MEIKQPENVKTVAEAMEGFLPSKLHNNPPPDEPTPFDVIATKIDGLYEEAKNWADGVEPDTQEQADEINKLIRQIQEAEKEADEQRKLEVEPHDAAKTEIQGRYNPLIGKTTKITGKTKLAVDACRNALKPFLLKAEIARKAEEDRLAKIAADKARAAQEAMQARDKSNLADVEAAEQLARDAKEAEKDAKQAARTRTGARGGARASTVRDVKTAVISDPVLLARWIWINRRSEMDEFMQKIAQQCVDGGMVNIEGVEIKIDQKVI